MGIDRVFADERQARPGLELWCRAATVSKGLFLPQGRHSGVIDPSRNRMDYMWTRLLGGGSPHSANPHSQARASTDEVC